MRQDRAIILIDMNSFFASVEQACNPALAGKPIGVCGEGRTVIVTSSYEARAFGVKTAMTVPEARRLCPGIILVPGNLEKYVDVSFRIHRILLDYTDRVEVFSIDECFMDVTDTFWRFGSPAELAADIKRRIKKDLNLLCSIGIAPSKPVAKLAAKYRKPDGLTEIDREGTADFMKKLPVEKLQGIGIGSRTARKLRCMGINNGYELGRASSQFLRSRFGIIGPWMKQMALGLDMSAVARYGDTPEMKSVGHSHTLPKDTADMKIISSYLLLLSEKTAFRMRKYGLTGRTISLYVRYSDFTGVGRSVTLKWPVNTGAGIYNAVLAVMKGYLPLKRQVRLLGISVSNAAKGGQAYLLPSYEREQLRFAAVDRINCKYGDFTVRPAGLLQAEKFGILERCGLIGKNTWIQHGEKQNDFGKLKKGEKVTRGKKGEVRVGTSGFSFTDWRGNVYPQNISQKNELNYYQEGLGFDCVEINATYYTIMKEASVASMEAKTGDNFIFVVKGFRGFTHDPFDNRIEKRPTIDEAMLAAGNFMESLKPLINRKKLGAILLQFPVFFYPNQKNREYINLCAQRLEGVNVVIEFRNDQWAKPETFEFLRRHNLGYCAVDEPKLPRLMPFINEVTSKTAYFRLHGRNKNWFNAPAEVRYDYLYSDGELKEYLPEIDKMAAKSERVFIFFNNCHSGSAARNASRLKDFMGLAPYSPGNSLF